MGLEFVPNFGGGDAEDLTLLCFDSEEFKFCEILEVGALSFCWRDESEAEAVDLLLSGL